MKHITHGLGSVSVADHGAVSIVRSLPGVGVYLSLILTHEEVDAIKALAAEEAGGG